MMRSRLIGRLAEKYPDSAAARDARKSLESLEGEGFCAEILACTESRARMLFVR